MAVEKKESFGRTRHGIDAFKVGKRGGLRNHATRRGTLFDRTAIRFYVVVAATRLERGRGLRHLVVASGNLLGRTIITHVVITATRVVRVKR